MARKTTVCTLVPDPLLFAALAVAAQRAQTASAIGVGAQAPGRAGNPPGLVSIRFTPRVAYFTLGIETGQLEYEVQDDQVTVRKADGSECMVFRLDLEQTCVGGRLQ